MKTAVTVIKTEQISFMDEYRDIRKTKVFTDESTIGEIKEWIIAALGTKIVKENLGLSGFDISDLIE